MVGMNFNRTNVNVWALPLTSPGQYKEHSYCNFENWTPPSEWNEGSNTLPTHKQLTMFKTHIGNGVIGIWDKELRTHYGFSVQTGKFLWKTDSKST